MDTPGYKTIISVLNSSSEGFDEPYGSICRKVIFSKWLTIDWMPGAGLIQHQAHISFPLRVSHHYACESLDILLFQ